ncbi:hypothetical protein BJ508DRAFT_415028 [Ascobolus immersus RN42]|uniref:Oxidoreductase acuF-like C2H2 type zinc-finger domain-containing protein n=1 Tax=Ascobolus immersus RN42 TaxID=1160509 RepID=A0A3N4I6A2_ASCIM|nr:hypothetical protein BJ508DRAFT_415028 [Ascobolus immersus RN42]
MGFLRRWRRWRGKRSEQSTVETVASEDGGGQAALPSPTAAGSNVIAVGNQNRIAGEVEETSVLPSPSRSGASQYDIQQLSLAGTAPVQDSKYSGAWNGTQKMSSTTALTGEVPLFLLGLASRRCSIEFEALLMTYRTDSAMLAGKSIVAEDDNLLEASRRFILWAGNVGACYADEEFYDISLDYRLRKSVYYREMVLALLRNLEDVLTRAKDELQRASAPTVARQTSTSGTGNFTQDDNSSLSSESGSNSHDSFDEFADEEITYEDLGIVRANGTRGGIRTSPNTEASTELRSTDILQSEERPQRFSVFLESIQTIVNCLYSLPLRRPANMDRLRTRFDAENNPKQHYQVSDCSRVRDMFPNLDTTVADRLGRILTQRRGILDYRQNHNRALQVGVDTDDDSMQEEGSIKAPPTRRTKATTLLASESAADRKFTDLDMRKEAMAHVTTAPSEVSSSASTEFTKQTRLLYPHRPKDDEGNPLECFECPYCCLTVHIQNERAWRKHVLKDISPYVCTHYSCPEESRFFESREQWDNHEKTAHRGQWFCNSEDHQPIQGEPEFILHLQTHHSMPKLTRQGLQKLAALFWIPSQSLAGRCHFCNHDSKRLGRHIARHLEQIAFKALPNADLDTLEDEELSDEDGHWGSSSSEQDSHSQTAQYLRGLMTEDEKSGTDLEHIHKHKAEDHRRTKVDRAYGEPMPAADLDNINEPDRVNESTSTALPTAAGYSATIGIPQDFTPADSRTIPPSLDQHAGGVSGFKKTCLLYNVLLHLSTQLRDLRDTNAQVGASRKARDGAGGPLSHFYAEVHWEIFELAKFLEEIFMSLPNISSADKLRIVSGERYDWHNDPVVVTDLYNRFVTSENTLRFQKIGGEVMDLLCKLVNFPLSDLEEWDRSMDGAGMVQTIGKFRALAENGKFLGESLKFFVKKKNQQRWLGKMAYCKEQLRTVDVNHYEISK